MSDEVRWFEVFFGRSRIAAFVIELNGEVTAVNDAALRMLGYGREELPSVSLPSVLATDADVVGAYQFRERLLRNNAATEPVVLRVRRKDGAMRWTEVECTLLTHEGGEAYAVFGTAVDISRTVSAEQREARLVDLLCSVRGAHEQLRRIHGELEQAVSGGELGAWEWIVPAGDIRCNDRCKRMLGYEPRELTPTFELWRDLVHPDDRHHVGETIDPLLVGRTQRFELEHRLRHKSGEWIWVVSRGRVVERDSEGRPVRVSGALLDIDRHKRAEEQLRLSRERYATYMRLASDGIYRVEFDRPVPIRLPADQQVEQFYEHAFVAEANDAMARMYGYARGEDLVGKRLEEFHGGRDREVNRAFLRRFVEGGNRVENVLSREVDREGTERYFRNTVFGLVEDGHLTRVWGTQHDVTELMRAQEALRQSEERFRRLAETIRVIPWESDIAASAFTYVGPRAVDILGYPLEAWLERGFWEAHIAPEDRDAAIRMCNRRIEEGAVDYTLEYRMTAADGRLVWIFDIAKVIREDSRPVRLRGFLIDITRQKQTQEALERHTRELAHQRRLTQKIFDTNPDVLYVFDLDKRSVVFRNRYVTRSLGYTVEQLNRMMPNISTDLMHPADLPDFLAHVDAMRDAAENEIRSLEYRLRAVDGGYRWFLSWDTPFERNEDGTVRQIIGTAVDITALKNAQADLERYQHRLEIQNEQLSSMNRSLEEANRRLQDLDRMKSDFVSVASHELRTPITSVLAFTQVLLSADETITAQSRRTYLQMIEREARRLGELASDLLDISKIESGRSELRLAAASLPSIAAEVIAGLTVPPDHSVSLQSDEAGNQPIVCDPGRIRQVLANLVENAVRYGTEVRVLVTGSASERRIDVSDNGPGIPPEELPRIFGKFYRARGDRTPGRGSGLGLAIARDIVRAHGGRIWADSTIGKGSVFHFTLNANLAPGERAVEAEELRTVHS